MYRDQTNANFFWSERPASSTRGYVRIDRIMLRPVPYDSLYSTINDCSSDNHFVSYPNHAVAVAAAVIVTFDNWIVKFCRAFPGSKGPF